MDPYLEDPPRWSGVHAGLIAHACGALNSILPPGYAAEIGERLWVLRGERNIYPDVAIVKPPRRAPDDRTGALPATADPPWVVTVEGVEMREVFIDIATIGDPLRVVTTIEVLSPGNKTRGAEGRALYLQKQEEILKSETHLIEIDLLRSGEHTVAAPQALLAERGQWTYVISLHRAGQGARFEVWPVMLRDRLPRVSVPLLEKDPDVVLDLQAVFDRMYDEGPYSRRVDYRRPPPLPLEAADDAWAEQTLRQRGLR
jgi:hypothetical protein